MPISTHTHITHTTNKGLISRMNKELQYNTKKKKKLNKNNGQ